MDATLRVDEAVLDSGVRRAPESLFGGTTVGEVLRSRRDTCKLLTKDQLGDFAEVVMASGRTAMAVSDEAGNLKGMLTVNDLLRAYFEGVPPSMPLGCWLASGRARAPPQLLQRLTVEPSLSLVRVAEKMVANAVAGDCACHHVVVKEDECLYGVISSHDLVSVLCHHDSDAHPGADGNGGAPECRGQPAVTVRDAMKPAAHVFTCPPGDNLRDALKVLLVTQQNSVMVVDEAGVRGFITTRDAVQAFFDGTDSGVKISEWLAELVPTVEARMVSIDSLLCDAAAKMTNEGLDHLVVVRPDSPEAVGVLSSMDVMVHTKRNAQHLRRLPYWKGPTVGEVLARESYLTEIQEKGFTLGQAASLMARKGRTSVIVQMSSGACKHELLTENEMLRAYLEDWSEGATVEELLTTTEAEHVRILQQYHVLPSVCLTDAASLMLSAAEPSHTCHHLVVRDAAVAGDWIGVFSALDIARALHGLSSELEVAKTGAEHTTVDMIMKPLKTVPVCSPTDTMYSALNSLDIYGQNAAVVEDDGGFKGLVTSRCALQAFVQKVPKDEKIGAWLERQHVRDSPRQIPLGTKLLEAASTMADHCLHHLLVVDVPGGKPVGVLSALDVARGVVSINYHCPFVTLGWLRLFGGATRLAEIGGVGRSSPQKRGHQEIRGKEADDCGSGEPAAKVAARAAVVA